MLKRGDPVALAEFPVILRLLLVGPENRATDLLPAERVSRPAIGLTRSIDGQGYDPDAYTTLPE